VNDMETFARKKASKCTDVRARRKLAPRFWPRLSPSRNSCDWKDAAPGSSTTRGHGQSGYRIDLRIRNAVRASGLVQERAPLLSAAPLLRYARHTFSTSRRLPSKKHLWHEADKTASHAYNLPAGGAAGRDCFGKAVLHVTCTDGDDSRRIESVAMGGSLQPHAWVS
jgi:hypothetical protein